MATRKSKNPELSAAANSLADAAHHVGQAFSQKADEIGATVASELDKAKQAALTKRGQATRRFDTLLNRVEGRPRKSLHKLVRETEKKLQTTKKAAQAKLNARPAAAKSKAPAKKAVAKKAPPKAAAAKKAPAKKVAAKKAAARAPKA
jgi:hypothetical protein